jgi:hypothetical protein
MACGKSDLTAAKRTTPFNARNGKNCTNQSFKGQNGCCCMLGCNMIYFLFYFGCRGLVGCQMCRNALFSSNKTRFATRALVSGDGFSVSLLRTLDAIGARIGSGRGRQLEALLEPAIVLLSYSLQPIVPCAVCGAPSSFEPYPPFLIGTHEQKSSYRLGIRSCGEGNAPAVSPIPLAM